MTSQEILEIAKAKGMKAADEACEWTFGIEYLSLPDGSELEYLNSGDTYSETVCRIDKGKPFLSSWGDCFESAEQEHEEENDVTHSLIVASTSTTRN